LAHLTVVVGESHPGQGVLLHRDFEEFIIVHTGQGTWQAITCTTVGAR
jgi:hypothetical protein